MRVNYVLLEPNDNENDEHRHHHGLMGAPMAQRPMWFTQISQSFDYLLHTLKRSF